MNKIDTSTAIGVLFIMTATALAGCTETRKKSEEVTDQVSGYQTIKQGEKARETLQRITDERTRELEAASGNR